jgi:CubicO group peptidase (beta-lactamase class C family)
VLGHNQDKFLKERIYGPLGMKDSTYYLTEEQVKRTAPTIKSDAEFRQGKVHDPLAYYSVNKDYSSGNAGLFSTAPDLEKYCKMILNQGSYNGKQIIKPGLVHLMTSIQSPEGTDARRGLGFGVSESFPWATSLNQSIGNEVAAHTGYTGTLVRIDKHAKTYLVLLTNRVYPDDKAKVTPLRKAVITTMLESQPIYAEIVEKEKEAEPAE